MKKYKITVHKVGEPGSDDEHIVQVSITQGAREIGTFQLEGGDFENAKAIGQGLNDLASTGFDLTELLPETPAIVGA